MKQGSIKIRGAKTHNLKNVSVDIPLNKITTLYGPSGSGKSSLAFETLHREAKRRLINSFPTDIKFFWDIPQTVEVDSIAPVLPTWGLPQINPVKGSRSTLGDLVNLTERFQRFFFMLGDNCCPQHGRPYARISVSSLLKEELLKHSGEIIHIFIRREDYANIFPGFTPTRSFDHGPRPFCREDAWWELTRLKKGREDSLEKFMGEKPDLSEVSRFKIVSHEATDFFYTPQRQCPVCGKIEGMEIKNFMMLSPYHGAGACRDCSGHGAILVYDREKLVKYPERPIRDGAVNFLDFKYLRHHRKSLVDAFEKHGLSTERAFDDLPERKWNLLYKGYGKYPGFDKLFEYLESRKYKKNIRIFSRKLKKEILCQYCQGTRLSPHVSSIQVPFREKAFSLGAILQKSIEEAYLLFHRARIDPPKKEWKHFQSFTRGLVETLDICCDLGLGHISLAKKVKELSASEYQRSLLIKFLSYEGSGALFIFDEPTVSLSRREEDIVLKYLKKLRNQKNTVLLVSHSPSVITKSDHVIEMGPSYGPRGGRVVYTGVPKEMPPMVRPRTHTKKAQIQSLSVEGAYDRDSKKAYSYQIPIKGISLVCGDSKVNKRAIVADLLSCFFSGTPSVAVPVKSIRAEGKFEKIVAISSVFTSVTSRASVGTTLGLIGCLRKHYVGLPASEAMNLVEGHFSPHSPLGQCSSCKGRGVVEVEMNFLENIHLACDDCRGMKIKPLYALMKDGPTTYYEDIGRPIGETFSRIKKTPKMLRTLHYLKVLNLDYLGLDRTLSSLSGGERQRLQLLREMQSTLREGLLLLEHISFGLSPLELSSLMELMGQIREEGNTIVIVDENPLLKRYAQHIVRL